MAITSFSKWDVDPHLLGAALMHIPSVIIRETDGHRGQFEPTGNVTRQHMDGASGFGGEQHIASEVEQPCHLIPSGDSLASPLLRSRGQVAGHDRDDEKCEERDPVLRVGDRERSERRQEKKSNVSIATTDVAIAIRSLAFVAAPGPTAIAPAPRSSRLRPAAHEVPR